uniref:hypothetical protein n=1 Tax=Sphingomonas bacterium TaxID=1895847 RepID=UPI00260DA724|nr:hypothetical protein [Sphingomonas bacterium]
MRKHLRTGATTAAIVMLTACEPASVPTDTSTSAAPAPVLVPFAASGLSPADEASIKADARARLLTRTRGMASLSTKRPCTDTFTLGDPRVIDSTLGPQTGRVKLIIPMTVYNSQGFNGPFGGADVECYGYSYPGYTLNQPYNISFEFQIERWQTGWHVAQIQANGF